MMLLKHSYKLSY